MCCDSIYKLLMWILGNRVSVPTNSACNPFLIEISCLFLIREFSIYLPQMKFDLPEDTIMFVANLQNLFLYQNTIYSHNLQ